MRRRHGIGRDIGQARRKVAGALGTGTQIACICGADTTYAELAETTAMTLKSAGATAVYLAGRPGAQEAALTAAGVDAYIVAGQDVVALLTAMQQALAASTG